MNAVPDASAKSSVADGSKGSLQSSFAAVIGATVAAATTHGDAKLGKAQNVDTKKTSSPESAKKNTSASSIDASIELSVAGAKVPVPQVVPVVPQVPVQPESDSPEQANPASADAATLLGSSAAEGFSTISKTGSADVTKPGVAAAPPKAAVGSLQDKNGSSKVDSGSPATAAALVFEDNLASAPTATVQTPQVNLASAHIETAIAPEVSRALAGTASTIDPKVNSEFVSTATSRAAKESSEPAAANSTGTANLDGTVADAAAADSTTAPALNAGIAPSDPKNAGPASNSGNSETALNTALFQAQVAVPLPVAIPAPANAVSSSPSQASASVASPSVSDVAGASKSSISGGVVKQAGAGTASASSGSGAVSGPFGTAPKTGSESVSVPHIQSVGTANVTPVSASVQPVATTPTTGTNAVSAPQPVEASVAAVTQQADTIAIAVPQQTVEQSSDAVGVSSASTLKVGPGKSEAMGGTSGSSPLGSKNRASASDWRLNRNFSTSDDKASSTDADGAAVAARAVTSEVGSKEFVGNIKGVLETAVLAQSAQSAQTAGPAVSVPVSSAPVAASQDSSGAAGTTLPAPAASTDSTQAAHALNSAQLIQSVHGSEMRLGMQSAEFGNISINTSISHQVLSAQISMEHSALGHALAMHLPAIEEKLGNAYGLQAKVELRDTANNSTASDSSSSESRGERSSQGGSTGTSTTGLQSTIGALTSSNFTPSSTSLAAGTSRLDIRI